MALAKLLAQVIPIRPDDARAAATATAVAAARGVTRVWLLLQPGTPPTIADSLGFVSDIELRTGTTAQDPGGIAGADLRRADAIVYEIDPTLAEPLARFQRFARELGGDVPVIAAVRTLDVETTRAVMRAGAADVLTLEFTAEDLRRTLRTLADTVPTITIRNRNTAKRGNIVAFVGAIGGCGTTTLATQAGILWAKSAQVCLIDFDLQFGNAALYLDLRPQLGLTDLIDAGARLDGELLRSTTERHASGLDVIAAPAEMQPLDSIGIEAVDRVLDAAAAAYDIVFVELPSAWTNWSMRVIERAAIACLVTGLSVPGLHQAKRQLAFIDQNGLAERFRLVVNRVVHPMFGRADMGESEAVLGRKIDFTIANDYRTVSAAIDQGKPLSAIKAKSATERDLSAMVHALVGVLAGAEMAA